MTCQSTAIPKSSFIAPPIQRGAVKNMFYTQKIASNACKNFNFTECVSKTKRVFDKVTKAFKEFPYKKVFSTIGACLASLALAGHIIFSLLISISILFLMAIV
jgi:hypothetical protein